MGWRMAQETLPLTQMDGSNTRLGRRGWKHDDGKDGASAILGYSREGVFLYLEWRDKGRDIYLVEAGW